MQESPVENGSYSDVMFTDVDTGTIVGNSGTILRTTDGGAVGEFYSVARRTTVSDKYGICDPWCSKTAECYPETLAGCDIECLCTLRFSYDMDCYPENPAM